MTLVRVSKRISYILRHAPQSVGIQLNDEGYANTKALCQSLDISFDLLEEIVEKNNKKRFEFNNNNKTMIKACQGHTIGVDLKLDPIKPPRVLYHGTATRFLIDIGKTGLLKMKRHHVHLSEDEKVAASVGRRYGREAVLLINSEKMYNDGLLFYKTSNNVWLTDSVPFKYIKM